MNIRSFFLFLLILMPVLFSCCKENPKEHGFTGTETFGNHNSRDSVDWEGVYLGTLPCQDCLSIDTLLELTEDNSYILKENYLYPNDEIEVKEITGKFTWDEDGSRITLGEGQNKKVFMVGEALLYVVDHNGNLISEEQIDKYILVKEE